MLYGFAMETKISRRGLSSIPLHGKYRIVKSGIGRPPSNKLDEAQKFFAEIYAEDKKIKPKDLVKKINELLKKINTMNMPQAL